MPKQQYILLLGHMRSYSTLLSHILGSHSEISGYTELHQSYLQPDDLKIMKHKITFAYEKKISTPFLLDKVLHNRYKVDLNFIQAPQVKVLIIIRQPDETVRSIIQMSHDIVSMRQFGDPNIALHYYENRLQQLIHYAQNTPKSMLFIEGEKLLQQSDVTLEKIRVFLDLRTPLNSEYSIYRLTGKMFYGDSSPEISSGKITVKPKKRNHIVIPQDILTKAQECYKECRATLIERCIM